MNLFINLLEETADVGNLGWFTAIMWIVIIAIFFIFIIRPQRKKDKADAEMRQKLEVGDEVVTAGGIVGIIFSIKDETVVIETGGDRSKIRVMKWAIAKCNTEHDD